MAGSSPPPSSSSSLKTLNSINLFSIKPPSSPPSSPSLSSPSLSSMKLKTLLQTFIFSHMYRALSKAKSAPIHLFKNLRFVELRLSRKGKEKKLYFGSFRLHYNWGSSSRAAPRVYCDYPGWSAAIPTSFRYELASAAEDSGELSKYLQWLEEREDEESCNEIDRLADLFIADCHEKFRLEKQESYRRFQEMMARSV